MTPARKAALQWFHDRGAVDMRTSYPDEPTGTMLIYMIADGQLDGVAGFYTLTDAGRRALNGDTK